MHLVHCAYKVSSVHTWSYLLKKLKSDIHFGAFSVCIIAAKVAIMQNGLVVADSGDDMQWPQRTYSTCTSQGP